MNQLRRRVLQTAAVLPLIAACGTSAENQGYCPPVESQRPAFTYPIPPEPVTKSLVGGIMDIKSNRGFIWDGEDRKTAFLNAGFGDALYVNGEVILSKFDGISTTGLQRVDETGSYKANFQFHTVDNRALNVSITTDPKSKFRDKGTSLYFSVEDGENSIGVGTYSDFWHDLDPKDKDPYLNESQHMVYINGTIYYIRGENAYNFYRHNTLNIVQNYQLQVFKGTTEQNSEPVSIEGKELEDFCSSVDNFRKTADFIRVTMVDAALDYAMQNQS